MASSALVASVREARASLSVDTRILVHSIALKEAHIATGAHVLVELEADAAVSVAGTAWPDMDAPSGRVSLPALMAPREMNGAAVRISPVREAPCAARLVLELDADDTGPEDLWRTAFLHLLRTCAH